MKRRGLSLAFIPVLLAFSALARGQGRVQIQEQAGSTFVMDDNFEYDILDYGVGQVQVRPADKANSLSPQVFWLKLRIVNRAEHSIQRPRYIASIFNPLRLVDNWGNTYWLKHPEASDVGGNWSGASLPIPDEHTKEEYKPGELSWDLRITRASDFVDGIRELRIYLERPFNSAKSDYFKIAQPFGRQRSLLREQADPAPSELQITLVTETPVPVQAPITKQKK
jgi:hypothetical protein